MKKSKILHITLIVLKLSFMAVFAETAYIASIAGRAPQTIAELGLSSDVPEMIRIMLLSVAIITAFGAAAAYVCGEMGEN